MPATQPRELGKGAPRATISYHRKPAPTLAWTASSRRGLASIGCTEYLCRAIQFGIYEQPSVPFTAGNGTELTEIPQTAEDKAFAAQDLEEGCGSGIYKEVSAEHAARMKSKGAIISSAFVVWQDTEGGAKPRFVVNFAKQSKHWKKGSVRMESLSEFAVELQRGDHFISMGMYKGCRHFRLAPAMRDWFIFRYAGRYYQCIALPFVWGRSPLWFTQLMVPFVRAIRSLNFRVLAYLDDFLISSSRFGVVSSQRDCAEAAKLIDVLLHQLGLERHPTKGCWTRTTQIEHLGVHIDSVSMRFLVAPRKLEKVRSLATKLLREVRFGKRWVSHGALAHFCGVCVSLTLAMPWARFYTRSLYWDMAACRPPGRAGQSQTQPSEHTRPAQKESIEPPRIIRSSNGAASANRVNSHG